MNASHLLLLGAGHYRQGPGVLCMTGVEALPFGKKALIVTGKKAWDVAKNMVGDSLTKSGIAFSVMEYGTYCSEQTALQVAETAKAEYAELIIGVGGGRCLDTAKYGADKANLRCITIPTIVATCAAYVPLCVIYDETGVSLTTVETHQQVAACLVDTSLIISSSPKRMLAAGIADALAKEPELIFSLESMNNPDCSIFPLLGSYVSQFTTQQYMQKGKQALQDFDNHTITKSLEDIISTNLALTGMISCLVSGGKHLAIAHAFYDCTTTLFKKQRISFLHGEIVGCGLPVQMFVNACPEEEITRMIDFFSSIGIPTKLAAFNIAPTKTNKEVIIEYICKRIGIQDPHIRQRIQEGFELIC